MAEFVIPHGITTVEELVTYLNDTLSTLLEQQEETTLTDILNLNLLNVEPSRPREGMIVHADGTNWNPGAGAGFYGYTSGSWTKLH